LTFTPPPSVNFHPCADRLKTEPEKKEDKCGSNKKRNKVGEGSERYHFYSGRRTFIGSEGSQAVYYLLAMLDWRKVKRRLSFQETDFFENAEGYRSWAVTVFGLNGKIQSLTHREQSPSLLNDQPATTISGKLL
jgi:hypothetical protein